MQIKQKQRNIFQITLTGHELAILISSSRWIVEGAKGELTTEAIGNLKKLLINYDVATEKLHSTSSS
jgi:N12 class adenine-specific DNA methylase